VIERFEVILEGLAADGHALLDHQRRFDGAESVALDGIRRPGEFDIVMMLRLASASGDKGLKLSSCSFLIAIAAVRPDIQI